MSFLPKKHRRWLWPILGVVLLAGIGAATIAGLTISARHAMERRIADLQRQGEPILPKDFETTGVDSPDNGAVLLDQASELLVNHQTDTPAWKDFDALEDMSYPLRQDVQKVLSAVVQENAAAFALTDEAPSKPYVKLKFSLSSPVILNLDRRLNGFRSLCNLLHAATVLDHAQGDDRSAIHQIESTIFLARNLDTDPSMVGHLVALGCYSVATLQLATLSPDLAIGDKPGQVQPSAVKHLIDTLLDDEPPRAGQLLALRAERMSWVDSMQWVVKGAPTPGAGPASQSNDFQFNPSARAKLYQNTSLGIDELTHIMVIATAADWPNAKAKLAAMSPVPGVWGIMRPSVVRTIETSYRERTDRHLAALALAVRWYAIEHAGAFPPTLNDLVPHYLPSVPLDPMADPETPLKYNPAAAQPVVYSVGLDGKDDEGSRDWDVNTNVQTNRSPSDWEAKDEVVESRTTGRAGGMRKAPKRGLYVIYSNNGLP